MKSKLDWTLFRKDPASVSNDLLGSKEEGKLPWSVLPQQIFHARNRAPLPCDWLAKCPWTVDLRSKVTTVAIANHTVEEDHWACHLYIISLLIWLWDCDFLCRRNGEVFRSRHADTREGGGKEEVSKSGLILLGSCFFLSKREVGEQVGVT